MKKFLIIITMFLILIMSGRNKTDFSLLQYFSGEYCCYTETDMGSGVNLGFCYMQTSNENTNKIIGESLKIENFEPISALKKLKAKLVKTECLEDGTVVMYAYSDLISQNVMVENNKVNLQIAQKDEYSIIGWPLILGSF